MTSLVDAARQAGQPEDSLPPARPHVLICTPCHSGKVDLHYHISLALAGGYLAQHGVDYTLDYNMGMSIDVARSQMASTFLQKMPECTHLLFIDDDMAFSADLPYRLLQENVDVVAVPYRRKHKSVRFNIRHGVRVKTIQGRPYMIGVESIATGMMLIRRNVFEKLAPVTPRYRYNDSGDGGWLFFRHQLVDDEMVGGITYMGEDYWFCKQAREAGFDIWAYVDEDLAHIGNYAFRANYREFAEKDTKDSFAYPGEKKPIRILMDDAQ